MMRRQLELFFTALMFYTRLPIPAWVAYSDEKLNQSTIYFPLMGWLVGGATAGIYWATSLLLPPDVALLLSMIAGILLTGAFHEDGFADVCDGFGGGWTAERILEIMKDSRLGTYGVTGLGLLLALKFAALRGLPPATVAPVLVVAHALSRATALTFIFSHDYARANDVGSKAKPVAKKISRRELGVGLAFGLLPLLAYAVWLGSPAPLLVLPLLAVAKWQLARYFRRWIGGYRRLPGRDSASSRSAHLPVLLRMDIYLIRHTRVATAAGICYGRADVALADSYAADEAVVRARLAPMLAAPHRAVASPLRRCRQLAEALVPGEVSFDDRLMEYDFGRWELQAWDALPAAELDPWMADFVHLAPPGGETFAAMQVRAVAFLEENLMGEEPLLIFGHSAVIRGLLCHCLGLPLQHAFRLDIDYGSVSKVRYTNGHFGVAYTNSL